jgi:hypothetical protein
MCRTIRRDKQLDREVLSQANSTEWADLKAAYATTSFTLGAAMISSYRPTMKNTIRNTVLSLLLMAASFAYGGIPPVKVSVSDAGGKAAYKGSTNATGAFATAKLPPGNYVVQFNSTSSELKGKKYALVVSAGKKKVSADVAGEKLAGGGVAMKVDVGAGLNITGQLAEQTGPVSKNGKKMVWIPPALGSNMPGHWAEEGSAEEVSSRTRGVIRKESIQSLQDHSYNPQG